jgi:hypothetical protein
MSSQAVAVRDRATAALRRGRDVTRHTMKGLADAAGPELEESVQRLLRVRSRGDFVRALEAEVERLLRVVGPALVENPLPVRNTATARAVVAGAAAAAAAGEEFEELALLFSAGASAPSTPVVLAGAFLALAVEVHVAVSLRVHDLRDAGLVVDPEAVARDVAAAMIGSKQVGGLVISKAMVRAVVKRLLRRWGTGLVPFVGVAYSGWDAQATISAIRSLPLPDGPRAERWPRALPSGTSGNSGT